MSRVKAAIAEAEKNAEAAIVVELEEMNAKPDDIPADVWQMIQENGRIATERLNEILTSPRFMRLKAGDQAKLIALAQSRAYGNPKTSGAGEAKRRVGRGDVVADELHKLAYRATLPEYKKELTADVVEDADYEEL